MFANPLLLILLLVCFAFSVLMITSNVTQTQMNANSIPSNATTSFKPSPISHFDTIANTLYKAASTPPTNIDRTKFDLETWTQKTTGGLDDIDRQTLGTIYSTVNSVFEFGLGESTMIASLVGVPRYVGVDSDAVYVTKVRNKTLPHFRFLFADVGETKAWGHPRDVKLVKNHFDYQIKPLIGEHEAFDIYLIDGRYRVPCAIIAFLHALNAGGDMDAVRVGVHDNDRADRKYQILKEVGEVVISNPKLWVYKLKDGVGEKDLFELWRKTEDWVMR